MNETVNSGELSPLSNADDVHSMHNSGRIIPGANRYTWDEQVIEDGPGNDKVKRIAFTPTVEKEAINGLSRTKVIKEEKVAPETKINPIKN